MSNNAENMVWERKEEVRRNAVKMLPGTGGKL